MPHRRSKQAHLRRKARQYIWDTSFRDYRLAETVCTVTRDQIIDYVTSVTEQVQMSQIPDVEKGLILLDSRGRGAFQT